HKTMGTIDHHHEDMNEALLWDMRVGDDWSRLAATI
ncbi:hypothetical protein A2U01_0059309, partial [Trifolium medium]|nr:hypothetical protein [Trifolium medium]